MRETSLIAYYQLKNLGAKQKQAYNYIMQFPDHTYKELGVISGMGENLRKRGSELEAQGLIFSSGKRTVEGRECHIWRAKE